MFHDISFWCHFFLFLCFSFSHLILVFGVCWFHLVAVSLTMFYSTIHIWSMRLALSPMLCTSYVLGAQCISNGVLFELCLSDAVFHMKHNSFTRCPNANVVHTNRFEMTCMCLCRKKFFSKRCATKVKYSTPITKKKEEKRSIITAITTIGKNNSHNTRSKQNNHQNETDYKNIS